MKTVIFTLIMLALSSCATNNYDNINGVYVFNNSHIDTLILYADTAQSDHHSLDNYGLYKRIVIKNGATEVLYGKYWYDSLLSQLNLYQWIPVYDSDYRLHWSKYNADSLQCVILDVNMHSWFSGVLLYIDTEHNDYYERLD